MDLRLIYCMIQWFAVDEQLCFLIIFMNNPSTFQFQSLNSDTSNKLIPFQLINQYYKSVFSCHPRGVYYPYNHQIVDVGWGCAWRAIQTLLSCQDIQLSFQQLYSQFSQKPSLLQILQSSNNFNQNPETIQLLRQKCWAPGEIQCHWAEPFIASIACIKYNLPYSLLLLNGAPQSYAPKQVFDKTISFIQLIELVKKYIQKSSIMIDDGTYALSIIGYNQISEKQFQFLFADPHIRNNTFSIEVGLYRKTFNSLGKSLRNDQTEIQASQGLYNVYQYLEFDTKSWMICFVNS